MADTAATAAAPPLLPAPPTSYRLVRPPLLPAPPTSRHLVRAPPSLPTPPSRSRRAPSPASAAPPSARASGSRSWIRDKAAGAVLPPPKPMLLGRASLSNNWNTDKIVRHAQSTAPSTESCSSCFGDRSSESNYGKEQRYEPFVSRSSGSLSWIRDKAAGAVLALPKPMLPGRASLSKNWNLHKIVRFAPPTAPSTECSNGGFGNRSSESNYANCSWTEFELRIFGWLHCSSFVPRKVVGYFIEFASDGLIKSLLSVPSSILHQVPEGHVGVHF